MQNQITSTLPLLKADGTLQEAGWARHPFWQYQQQDIKAPWWRIKEWDYYYLLSDDLKCGITVTISDLGYAGLMAICWLDFEKNEVHQVESMLPLSKGRLGLGPDSKTAKVVFKDKKLSIDYHITDGKRHLTLSSDEFMVNGIRGLEAQLVFKQKENYESINICSSWAENRKAFYYNQKINYFNLEGSAQVGGKQYNFNNQNAHGALDWGRGNWTYKNRWFWASANGDINGKPFALNLGYGFSDRSQGSENAIFYDGILHKLTDVKFHFDESDYLAPWTFTSSDGRFEASFEPLIDRASKTNLLIIRSKQHQVFGCFNGKVILDDGTELKMERILGFAEDVFNCF